MNRALTLGSALLLAATSTLFAQTIPAGVAGAAGSAEDRGFRVRSAQAPFESSIGHSLLRAIQQLNGTLVDEDGKAVEDEAIPGDMDGYYHVDVINFERDGDAALEDIGNFGDDTEFPGIPGSDGHTDLFATEVLGYIELAAGANTLGGQVFIDRTDAAGGGNDDSFTLFIGTNPKDYFATQVATYFRSDESPSFSAVPWDYEFEVNAPEAGIYPMRLVYYSKVGNAALEFYSDGPDLVNDPEDGGAVAVYRKSNDPKHDHAYIGEVAPTPGTAGVEASLPIEILLIDDETTVTDGSVVLTYNGVDITGQATIATADGRTNISYNPPPGRQNENNALGLTYMDSAGTTHTQEWSFKSAIGDKPPAIVGQWDFEGGLDATFGQPLEYLDGAGGITAEGTVFGTTSDFGIVNLPGDDDGTTAGVMCVPGDVDRDVGYILTHGMDPNGGGSFVNQYTLIMDVMQVGGGSASAILQASPKGNASDASFFWQGGNMGQGGGGYEGDGSFTPDEWHRIAFSVDLAASPRIITKWVDGVLQDEWQQQRLDQKRRALEPEVWLFQDADERSEWYVNSIQLLDGALSIEAMEALAGPTADGVPGAPSGVGIQISKIDIGDGTVAVEWESRPNKSYTIQASPDLQEWIELTDGHPSQGDLTAFTETLAAPAIAAGVRYYQVTEE